jgi:aryl-alcohol dehydrogenase-like predicted oxidoreductase
MLYRRTAPTVPNPSTYGPSLLVIAQGRIRVDLGKVLHFGLSEASAKTIRRAHAIQLPGTRSADHLHENLRAVDVQLTPADLREIETALSKIKVHGGRMNEERMNAVDQTE